MPDVYGEDDPTNQLVSDILVIDSCPTHAHDFSSGHHVLAGELGLELKAAPDLQRLDGSTSGAITESYVLVIGTIKDVKVVRPAMKLYPIRAVVSWRLPEGGVLDLLHLPIPVFCGIPTREEWNDRLYASIDRKTREEQMALARMLTQLETELSKAVEASMSADKTPDV